MFKDKYLTLSKDNTLKLWRTRTLQHMRTVQLGEGTGWINAAIHLPDVKRLVLASALGKLHALDAHTLRVTSSFRLPFVPQALTTLPEGDFLTTEDFMPGSESEDLVLLGDQHGKLHFLHQAALAEPGASLTSAAAGLLPHLTAQLHSTWVEKLEWVRDLGGLMSSSADGSLQLSDLSRGAVVARHRVSNPSGKPIKSFAWCSKHAMVAPYLPHISPTSPYISPGARSTRWSRPAGWSGTSTGGRLPPLPPP